MEKKQSQPATDSASDDDIYTQTYNAFFRPRSHKFETIDYRLPFSLFNRRNYFPLTSAERIRNARVAGLLGIVIGFLTSIAGFCVDQMARGLTIGLYEATQRVMSTSFWAAFFTFNAISVLYCLVPAFLVVFWAPLGAGAGLDGLKALLNGVQVPGFLAFKTFIVKTYALPFTVSAGLICGRMGPIIHIGAIVGAAVSQAASGFFKWRLKSDLFKTFRTEAWKRDFISVGSSTGIAVAFGTPFGAWLWTIEEAATHWSWELGVVSLAACLSGAIITRVFNFLAAGQPNFDNFSLGQVGKMVTAFPGTESPLKDIVGFLIVGIMGGIVGALLPMINRSITLFRYKNITKPASRILEVVVITILTASIKILIPYFHGGCTPVPEIEGERLSSVLSNAPLRDFSQFDCPDGQFSTWAATSYNPTDSVLRAMFFDTSDNTFFGAPLAITTVYFLIFVIVSYGMAVPAGIFFPGFLLGGVYGRLIGVAVQAIFPERTDVPITMYSFLGAVSGVAGITRNISVALIAIEATGNANSSYVTLFVAFVSKVVTEFIYKQGIYDLHIGLKGMPYLPNLVPKVEMYSRVLVSEVMRTSIVAVRRKTSIAELVYMLKTNGHHSFPVYCKMESSQGAETSMETGTELRATDGITPSNSQSSGGDNEMGSKGLSNTGEWIGNVARTTIVMPTSTGMHATIFAGARKHAILIAGEQDKPKKLSDAEDAGYAGLEYQLLGMIDRSTLLALMKHQMDSESQTAVINDIPRSKLDSAWPNPSDLKGKKEKDLLERVETSAVMDVELDLKQFVDMDPLLISDSAPAMSAHSMFRKSGSRHILVANMRNGRITGMLTRKDILEDSVSEAFDRKKHLLEGVKVHGSK